MKIEENTRQIITNTDNSHEFTIQNNAKMFQILSDKIYTYKVAAIVREISCNAYDSHIEAGIPDTPFKVVLPNSLHEYFEIEDFGVGLDEEQVYNIYTSYGTSTKSNSNAVIGAFGLGSKTPFAYTTSFTIQTRKDGVEYLFNAYIGNAGAPTCSLLRKRDTDEPNGVKIKIPVKTHHCDLFKRECKFILSFFPTRPEVVGHDFEFDFTEEQIAEINHGDLTILDTSSVTSEMYQNKQIYAVMGTVCYPVQMQDIVSGIGDRRASYLRNITNIASTDDKSAFLKFDIGELDVNASREGLSIEEGKKTEQNLTERFSRKIDDLFEEDNKIISEKPHYMQALSYVYEKYGDGIEFVAGMFKYKGESIDHYMLKDIKSPYYEMFTKTDSGRYYWSTPKTQRLGRVNVMSLIRDGYVILTAKSNKTRGFTKYSRILAKSTNAVIVASNDKAWSQTKIDRYAKFIGMQPEKVYYIEDLRAEERAKKNNGATVDTTTKQSLPKKKKEEIRAKYYTITDEALSEYKSERINVVDWKQKDYKLYYVHSHFTYNGSIVVEYNEKRCVLTDNRASAINKISGDKILLVVANTRNQKSIDANGVEYFGGYIEKFVDDNDAMFNTVAKIASVFELDFTDKVRVKYYTDVNIAIVAKSKIVPEWLYKLYEEAEFYSHMLDDGTVSLIKTLYGPGIIADKSTEIEEIEHQFCEAYPLMRYTSRYTSDQEGYTKAAAEYIKMIDNKKSSLHHSDNSDIVTTQSDKESTFVPIV